MKQTLKEYAALVLSLMLVIYTFVAMGVGFTWPFWIWMLH